MIKNEIHIDETIDFEESFHRYITGNRFSTKGGFYGQIKNNKFFFGRVQLIRNSFPTVIYGEVDDNTVYYWYGKDWVSWVIVIIIETSIVLYFSFLTLQSIIALNLRLIFVLIFVLILLLMFSFGLFLLPMKIYSKKEKERLYFQLLKICGKHVLQQESGEWQ